MVPHWRLVRSIIRTITSIISVVKRFTWKCSVFSGIVETGKRWNRKIWGEEAKKEGRYLRRCFEWLWYFSILVRGFTKKGEQTNFCVGTQF